MRRTAPVLTPTAPLSAAFATDAEAKRAKAPIVTNISPLQAVVGRQPAPFTGPIWWSLQ